MSGAPDYYAVLGVDPTATPREIGRAYRQLVRKYHPDTSRADNALRESEAQELRQVMRAYEVLGDAGRRAEYDRDRADLIRRTDRRLPSPDTPRPPSSTGVEPDIRVGPVYINGRRQDLEQPEDAGPYRAGPYSTGPRRRSPDPLEELAALLRRFLH